MTDFTKQIQVALFAAMVAAGGANCLAGQVVMTRPKFTEILAEAQQVSSTIDTLNRDIARYSRAGLALAEEIKAHNDEPCEALSTHPEMCLDYHDAEVRLNQSRDSLLKEWKGEESDRRRARGYFGQLMEQLRTATWSGAMASWRDPVTACSNMEFPSDAVPCLKRVLARHP